MKEEKVNKIVWTLLCVCLLLFIMGFTSCGSPKYGKEEISISSEFKWENIACKMGNDTVIVKLKNGSLGIHPHGHGEVEIIAHHTRESIYLDRFYGAVFVYVYLENIKNNTKVSFEQVANYIFDIVYKLPKEYTGQDSVYINSVTQN